MVDGYEVENDQEKENYKNQALEVILTNQYINRYGSGMEQDIGGNQDYENIQKYLMGLTNNSLVS